MVGISAITFSGNATVNLNTTGGAVSESITVGSAPNATTLNVQFSSSEGNVQAFTAMGLNLSIGNFVTVTGNFAFSKTVESNTTKVLIGATGVNAFLGTADQSVGVRVSNASLGLVLYGIRARTRRSTPWMLRRRRSWSGSAL